MTQLNPTRWVEAVGARRVCDAALRTSRQIFQRTDEIGRGRFVTDLSIDGGAALAAVDGSAPRHIPDQTSAATWAKISLAALAVVAGVMALDFVVLWFAAGRVIERLPF
jgi:hypothetical protein